MRYVSMPGLAGPVSAIALGTAEVPPDEAPGLYDLFVEGGGTIFDTAWHYRKGEAERAFGRWLKDRGLRDRVAIIGKGAHSPDCYPHVVGEQLAQSLERLQVERVDVYMPHRDNLEIPVGEFVDAIDAEVSAGRIGAYGLSNWTLARVEEAIAYAEARGRARPTSVSNNFSLARMLEPVWRGVEAASTPEWRARLAKGDLGLFAWSSQARGFFTDRSAPDKHDDPELVRCWYSEENFARKARAVELAERRGATPIRVALAYCLHQPFPLVPLVGPVRPAELADCLEAADLVLTPDEVAWLEG